MKKEIQEEKTVQNRIIDTAVPLFAMKGYAGVSVRELAKEAGVNIALISYYFGGKEKLYSHILSSHFNIIELALSNIQKELSPKDKIISFQKQIIILSRKYPYLIRLAIGEITNPTICYNNIVKAGITKLNQFLKTCIAEGIEAGDFRNDIDPAVVALSFISVINFYLLTWPLGDDLLQNKDSKTEYYIEQAFDNYFLGILNTEKK